MYRSYTPTCYICFFFFFTPHYDCILFYGPIVPEINYSILFYSILRRMFLVAFGGVLVASRMYVSTSALLSCYERVFITKKLHIS